MHVEVTKPHDGLLFGRAELLAGWVEAAGEDFAPSASCGGRPVPLRPCFHPVMLDRPRARGFWGYLFPQQVLDRARDEVLTLELFDGEQHLAGFHVRLTPSARDLAARHPLDLLPFGVPPSSGAPERVASTVVFPGLGGVGGASLNEVLRLQMLREGGEVTVHSEADHAPLWARVPASQRARYRWIDGHACHGAAGPESGVAGAVRVTLLRDPVRRMVSVFDYGRLVHPEVHPHPRFEDFLASPAARRATQAVGLLRLAGVDRPEELPDDELYSRAAAELATSYELVGVTERFEETLLLVARLAGLAQIGPWWRVLSAPRSVDETRLPPTARDRLEALVAVDRRLHADATSALESRLAKAGLGSAPERLRAAATRPGPLPPLLKQIECLRWRETLLASALRQAHG